AAAWRQAAAPRWRRRARWPAAGARWGRRRRRAPVSRWGLRPQTPAGRRGAARGRGADERGAVGLARGSWLLPWLERGGAQGVCPLERAQDPGPSVGAYVGNTWEATSRCVPSPPNLGPVHPNLGPVRPNLGPVRPNLGPVRPNLGPVRPNLGPVHPNLGPVHP